MAKKLVFINKKQEELIFDDFYDGQYFEAVIQDKLCTGRVTIENNCVYLCQDTEDGADCMDKKGFDYSYIILEDKVWVEDNDLQQLTVSKNDHGINMTVSNLDEDTFDWLLSSFSDELKLVSHSKGQLTFLPGPSGLLYYFDHAYNKTKNVIREKKLYLSIDGLDDPSDERVIMMHADSMSFVGFSKLTGSPIFKMLEDSTGSLNNLPEEIILLGGAINAIQPEDINEHIDL